MHSCWVQTTLTLLPKKNATEALILPNHHSTICFHNDPVDLKAAIPALRTSPINTGLSSQASRAQAGRSMFSLGPGGAEVARVNRSFDTNRPVPGNWPIKSPEHALNGLACRVEELSTDY